VGWKRRLLVALAWLAIAALVAVGGAGAATALNHPPSTATRPELTWAADAAATAALDVAAARLQTLSDAVDALGASSKTALASLVAGDTTTLESTLDKGAGQLETVSAAAADLQAAISAVPYQGDGAALLVSAPTIARYQVLAAAPALAANLQADWAVLSARATAASVIPALLARHDQQTAAAATQGEAGHYAAALALLDAPDATMAQARQAAAALAKTVDVSTLNDWIARQAAYDAALRQLYEAMLGSSGRVTAAVKAAFAAEEAAKSALPTSTKGIVVIMGDIARGGLSQAAIDIEVVRGSLAAALSAQGAPPAATTPSASPVPSGSTGVPASAGTSPSGSSAPAPSRSSEATPPP
jgi:hypothetical protein